MSNYLLQQNASTLCSSPPMSTTTPLATHLRRFQFATAYGGSTSKKCHTSMGNKISRQRLRQHHGHTEMHQHHLTPAHILDNSNESKIIVSEHNNDDDDQQQQEILFDNDDDDYERFVLLGASVDSATAKLKAASNNRVGRIENVRSMDDNGDDDINSQLQPKQTTMDNITMAINDIELKQKDGNVIMGPKKCNGSSASATVMRNRSTSSSKCTNNSISLHHTSNRYHRTSPIAPSKARKTNAALSASAQAIVKYCFDNAREDIGNRIFVRMAHKRDDFAQFCSSISVDQFKDMCTELRQFIASVVSCVDSVEQVRNLASNYGVRQVSKRAFGFKADYFAAMADAVTTECVFLDAATHQPTEAIEAWADLVALMFSSIRDGFYQQIRYLRRRSYCFNSQSSRNTSSDLSSDGSDAVTRVMNVAVSSSSSLNQSIVDDDNHRLSASANSGYSSSNSISPSNAVGIASVTMTPH